MFGSLIGCIEFKQYFHLPSDNNIKQEVGIANSFASLNMKERSSDFKTLQNYLLQREFLDLCSLKGRLCKKNTYVKIKHILVNKNNLKGKSN